jgi:hypothetical protein
MPVSVCLIKNRDVIAQRVQLETVLFEMNSGHYYSLNELGAKTWELLDGNRTVREIAECLASEYDAPADLIEPDIESLLKDLLACGLLLNPKSEDGCVC